MSQTPEELEKLIHQTLRSVPERRAPRSLEARVLAAIEAQAMRPWWRQSFAQWPMAARVAFVIGSAGLAKVALLATIWVMAGFDSAQFAGAFSTQYAWLQTASGILAGAGNLGDTLYRNIPSLWLYGGLAFIATLYASLFGLGAAAYRTLYANR